MGVSLGSLIVCVYIFLLFLKHDLLFYYTLYKKSTHTHTSRNGQEGGSHLS